MSIMGKAWMDSDNQFWNDDSFESDSESDEEQHNVYYSANYRNYAPSTPSVMKSKEINQANLFPYGGSNAKEPTSFRATGKMSERTREEQSPMTELHEDAPFQAANHSRTMGQSEWRAATNSNTDFRAKFQKIRQMFNDRQNNSNNTGPPSPIPKTPPPASLSRSSSMHTTNMHNANTSSPELTISKTEINILLLGETGAGKSTTLNAMANYLNFSSFEDALQSINDFTEVISSQFVLPDPRTGQSLVIKSGPEDVNEKHDSGNSCTQSPIAYTFYFGNSVLRIIDTPGVGDTEGVEVDKEHFKLIMEYLQQYKKLDAVLFIVKNSDSRKNTFFKYCITELLAHLHKSVSENIIFCFTYSRGSFFGPGEGFTTLKGFLENDIKDVQLKLTPGVNSFFIDNEAYRFFVAKRSGYSFEDYQELGFKESWNRSVSQIEQMFAVIMNLPAHDLVNTITLNNSRKIIMEMAEPIIQLQENIRQNIEIIKKFEHELITSNKSKEELARGLSLDQYIVKMRTLKNPSLVCTSDLCSENVKDDAHDDYELVHKTCHENCNCWWVKDHRKGQFMIQMCKVMRGIPRKCKVCGCKWDQHMQLSYKFEKIKKTIIDKEKVQQIQNKEDAIKVIDQSLKKAHQLQEEWNAEMKIIQEVGSIFAYFLNKNSFVNTNNYYEQYLDFLIDEENKKSNPNPQRLLKLKQEYKRELDTLRRAIQDQSQSEVSTQDILEYQNKLLQLKHSGKHFAQMLKATHSMEERNMARAERRVLSVDTKRNRFWDLLGL